MFTGKLASCLCRLPTYPDQRTQTKNDDPIQLMRLATLLFTAKCAVAPFGIHVVSRKSSPAQKAKLEQVIALKYREAILIVIYGYWIFLSHQ